MAQEVCYWPNGLAVDSSISGLRYWPCHHGTSSCCAEGEACLSNGLCYSPAIDSVRATFSWYTVCILKNLPRHIAALALIQAGRNVPTNIATTVGRIEDHKPWYHRMVKRLILIVSSDKPANIWKCAPGDTSRDGTFWCGTDNHVPNPNECQVDAESGKVVSWTSATLLTIVRPPTASLSTQVLTRTSTILSSVFTTPLIELTDDSLASTSESSPTTVNTRATSVIDKDLTGTARSSPTTVITRATSVIYQNQTVPESKNSSNSMAIGTGLGVPFGLALIGFIGYLLLRNRSCKNVGSSHLPRH